MMNFAATLLLAICTELLKCGMVACLIQWCIKEIRWLDKVILWKYSTKLTLSKFLAFLIRWSIWRSKFSLLKFDWSFFDFVKYLKWNFLEPDKCSKSFSDSRTYYVSDSKRTRDVTNLVSRDIVITFKMTFLIWHNRFCSLNDFLEGF